MNILTEKEPITFIDTEIEPKSRKILDIGCIRYDDSSFHKNSVPQLIQFLKGTQFICGHNIFNHDIKYIGEAISDAGINPENIIDTLFLSPLLFPTKPYHALVKDDKLQTEEVNNPLNDSIKAKELFLAEIDAFQLLGENLKKILFLLLNEKKEFGSFFRYLGYASAKTEPGILIGEVFKDEICGGVDLTTIIHEYPVALAYCLSLIGVKNRYSITPRWVLRNYPEVEQIMFRLRNNPCIHGCTYCNIAMDVRKGLKKYFGFDSFRNYAGEPLQEKAVSAATGGKSILVVFPTGGGKSITFQLPALMSGENAKALTVVISPLQSLMKDQVDNLEKMGITDAVAINGLLDPIEKAKSFERVAEGSASLLYISPESLRSRTIENLLLGRKIARFVIDEAHCFSSWGQDFRVDYLYIGDFIKSIQEKKNLTEGIPVSCFTATAKQKVIQDILDYFKKKLALSLELFTSKAARTNLRYKVLEKGDEIEKYQAVRDLLEEKDCPTIIYVSRTKKAGELARRLSEDGFNATSYHGKMDTREKTENQNAFVSGEIPIIVATSAFGMGVDKKDVGMVIHYDISDSLENYVQEAGRAGRDENMVARCFILFNEEDLGKHFVLLNQTRLSIREIQQVWKSIKEMTRFRSTVSNSALEIARTAGWDDNIKEVETRVTTAIAALEDAGYLKRGQNMPRVFANSILSKNAEEAIDKINVSDRFDERQKTDAIRIIKKLLSSKSRKNYGEDAGESRVDYISDHLGISREEIIRIIQLLREEKILADAKDLTAFIRRGENKNRSLAIAETYGMLEKFLLSVFEQDKKTYHLKELNEGAEEKGYTTVTPAKIKTIINFWAIKNWINRQNTAYSKNQLQIICLHPVAVLKEKLEKQSALAMFIVELLFEKSNQASPPVEHIREEVLVEFSVQELKTAYENSPDLFRKNVTIDDIEDTLFYLSRIDAIKIEGGFMVLYNRLTIERIEQNNKKQYTTGNYEKLNQFYENKVQQIHIVGEYVKRMIIDYSAALQFVDDYFRLNYSSFLKKYFPGSKADELSLKMTPAKFRQMFGELSPAQLKIINDKESKYIVVAAGPGSGKTKVLVHKLASLLLMEDVKHEQLLMVTFSRSAVSEFRQRLFKLIGAAANYIEIKTFHSYCFDLLGRIGTLGKSDDILKKTIDKIKNGEVEASRITKTVLVIDEAQDMDADEYSLIRTLMTQNEDMRVIAVGDDDQNIYEFRGSSSKYLEEFIRVHNASRHELIENYRSKGNLVDFSNQFARTIPQRIKTTPIISAQRGNGKIHLIHHTHSNLTIPLVSGLLKTELTGSTCVLTKTNEEALQVTGLLAKQGVQARLIQTNDEFSLTNLLEIRHFLNQLSLTNDTTLINDEIWEKEKRELRTRFRDSSKLEVCDNIIREFEATYPKRKYKSDLDTFIRESKLQDFFNADGETIFVSTIHKAKGREFDNVFLMLDNFNIETAEAKRQLYVAMTRAKERLSIHLNSNFLDGIETEDLKKTRDTGFHLPPDELAMHLTFKDVWLDYFTNKQWLVSQFVSGDNLILNNGECLNQRGQSVLKFSKKFLAEVEVQRKKGYKLSTARVNFIIYWRSQDSEQEIKIILPEVWFKRMDQAGKSIQK